MINHIMKELETCFDRIVDLGSRYKAYRRALGVSQREIHRKTGVALSTISLFENGKGQGLSLTHFYLLMDALDLNIDAAGLIPEVQRSDLASLWRQQNKKGKK